METKKDYINRLLNEARMRGLCKTQKEFAALVGMDQSTISNALKGNEKYLTDSIIRRLKSWERQVLNPAAKAQPQPEQKPDIIIPAATAELYTAMAKSIDRLTALVERLQPGATAFQGAVYPGQKNYRIDGE